MNPNNILNVFNKFRIIVLLTVVFSPTYCFAENIITKLAPTPQFNSSDGSSSAKFVGFGQIDFTANDSDTLSYGDGTTIRRARLGIAGKYDEKWGYKLLYDFANNNNPQLQDMFISYNGFGAKRITVGQFKEPIGLEWQTPSKYWTFMELPLTTALTPRRSIGAGLLSTHKDVRFNLGLFGENSNKTRTENEGYSIDLHLVYNPKNHLFKHLHIGTSLSYRTPDASGQIAYGAKHETSLNGSKIINTGSIQGVEHITLIGGEMLYQFKDITLQSEYMSSTVSTAAIDDKFSSAYIQASWMLTGDSRKFNNKKHHFTRVKPTNKKGAWEIALRGETLDLNATTVTAGELKRIGLAISWYGNSYTRISLNYTSTETSNNNSTNNSVQAVALRTQIDL